MDMNFQDVCMVGQLGWDHPLASDDCPDDGFEVTLHVYDLSQGLAASMSPMFLGRRIDGIWHTGVVAYGKEWFFGGGICYGSPGRTPFGGPTQRLPMGRSFVPPSVFREFLLDATHSFNAATYNLLRHNCNNFSSEVCTLLVGQPIPAHITGLPDEVLQTPLGQMLQPMIDALQGQMQGFAMGATAGASPPPAPAPAPAAAPPPAATPAPIPTPIPVVTPLPPATADPVPAIANPAPVPTTADAPAAPQEPQPAEAFTVTVKTVFNTAFTISAQPAQTVAQLKAAVVAQEGYLADSVNLIWTNKRILKDEEVLGSIGLPAKPTLIIAGRKPKPAPQAPAATTSPLPAPAPPQPTPPLPPAAAAPAPPVAVDEGLVAELTAMGFGRDATVLALQTVGNDLDRAIENLVAAPPAAAPTPDPTPAPAAPAPPPPAPAARPPGGAVPTSDRVAAERLSELGFPLAVALEAYIVCGRNEEIAANYLFEHGAEAAEELAAAQSVSGLQATTAGQQRILGSVQGGRRTVMAYEDPAAQAKARAAMPVAQLEERARAAQETAESTTTARGEALQYRDLLVKELLRWFKTEFFTWFNAAKCEACGSETHCQGGCPPSAREADQLWAGTTELYQCNACRAVTRFPRINNPGALLDTRTGRCGEWANCFTLCCRALGFDVRWVQDFTDHVWTEYWSDALQRWVHLDPCENTYDNPRMYESGWGKKLTYVIAHSREEVVDVTPRYSADWPATLGRRDLVAEEWLAASLQAVNGALAAQQPADRQREVEARRERERQEWAVDRGELQAGERLGRQTGDLEWRRQRGELGEDPHP